MAPAYIYSVFVLAYGTTVLGSSLDLLLSALLALAALSFFTVPIAGYLSDSRVDAGVQKTWRRPAA